MKKMTKYQILLGDTDPQDPEAIKTCVEHHAEMFENALLSTYSNDSRYFMLRETFNVLSVLDNFIEYSCQLNFYAGCSDKNETFEEHGRVRYQIEENKIVFELDETVWHPE